LIQSGDKIMYRRNKFILKWVIADINRNFHVRFVQNEY
jgi:hypothetical protein